MHSKITQNLAFCPLFRPKNHTLWYKKQLSNPKIPIFAPFSVVRQFFFVT